MNKGFLSWIRSNDKYIINELEKQSQLVVDATAYLTKIAETSDTDKMKSYQSQITEIEEGGDHSHIS